MTETVAEIVTFELTSGVTQDQFVALSKTSEVAVRAMPGFVHRHLSCDNTGHWTDYVIWDDMASAKAAAKAFPEQDFAPDLMAAIAPDSVKVRHEFVHWSMPPA